MSPGNVIERPDRRWISVWFAQEYSECSHSSEKGHSWRPRKCRPWGQPPSEAPPPPFFVNNSFIRPPRPPPPPRGGGQSPPHRATDECLESISDLFRLDLALSARLRVARDDLHEPLAVG